MVQEILFGIGVLAIFATMVVLSRLVARRAWNHKADIHEFHDEEGKPDDTTEGMRDGLNEWLQNDRIVRAMMETKTATQTELQTTLLALPIMSAIQVRSTCKALLRDRNVRRVIAVEFAKARNWPKEKHSDLLVALAEWAQIEPQRLRIASEKTG